jgi:hypothetical protein
MTSDQLPKDTLITFWGYKPSFKKANLHATQSGNSWLVLTAHKFTGWQHSIWLTNILNMIQ